MESLGRMVAIIIAVVLLIFFPIRYQAQKSDLTVNSYVDTEMDYFFHQVRSRQEITQTMYDEFSSQLSVTGASYKIEIERYTPIVCSEEEKDSYLEYKDVIYELKSSNQLTFQPNDYILIRVCKQESTLIDKLKNLFLPTAYEQSTFVIGGCIG